MARRKDTPCADCGTLLWSGTGSLAAGQRRCQPCRRAANPPPGPRGPIGCANLACQRTIEKPHGRQRFCSPRCRHRVTDAHPLARARWARKNAKRRPNTPGLAGAGSRWQKLRRQVLTEEPQCWVCGDEIDPELKWPHPMCGTGDHVVPVEAGGALLDRANVRAAHRFCNQQRHVQWRREQRAAGRAA